MNDPDCHELLDCAVQAAKAAGKHALSNRRRRHETVGIYKHDVKLVLDCESQAVAEKTIKSLFPGHSILGEESPDSENGICAGNNYTWIIDPIDGTVNFTHGLPWWCCSIAVYRNGSPIAGAVFAPALDRIYTASIETGAMCNSEAIHVSGTSTLPESLVMTGTDKHSAPGCDPDRLFAGINSSCRKARIMGSAALDICQVAAGSADAFFESGIYIWDIAAAALIAEQAGGKSEILLRRDKGRLAFLASNGVIHGEMADLVRKTL